MLFAADFYEQCQYKGQIAASKLEQGRQIGSMLCSLSENFHDTCIQQ